MQDDFRYCWSMLPRVSRTFALAVRVLPPSLRSSVLVAYLFCRIADVIEDDTTLPKVHRERALDDLRAGIRGYDGSSVELASSLARLSGASRLQELSPEEAVGWELAGNVHRVVNCLWALPLAHREWILLCIDEMTDGMSRFVWRERAPLNGDGGIIATLEDETDLEAYADCVAGSVGRLLHRLFCDDLGITGWQADELRVRAVPFGLGLQYTNIIQDLVADRRRGWCYVPESMLRKHGLTSEAFLEAANSERALGVVEEMIRKATPNLERALEFTLMLPRRAPRVRLFCLWPLFLAVATLARVWGNPSILEGKVKVNREQVRRLMLSTSAWCLWERPLRSLFDRESVALRA